MKVYIQSVLGDAGKWVDVEGMTSEEFFDEVKSLNREEVIIADYEGFCGYPMGELSVSTLGNFLDFLSDKLLDDAEIAVFLLYLTEIIGLWPADKVLLEDYYGESEEYFLGAYRSEVEFVQEFVEDLWGIPEHLKYYIDWDKMARDYEADHYFIKHDGLVYVFQAG